MPDAITDAIASDLALDCHPTAAPWLRKLADRLTEGVPGQLNMSLWWGSSDTGCGTAGCAIGWGIALGVCPPDLVLIQGCYPALRSDPDARDSVAVARAYGLSHEVTGWLFGGRYGDLLSEAEQLATVIRRLHAVADAIDVNTAAGYVGPDGGAWRGLLPS